MKEYEFNNTLLLQDALIKELDNRKYRRIISNNDWITFSLTRKFCEKEMQAHQHVQSLLKAKGSKEQSLIEAITNQMTNIIVKEHFALHYDFDIHVSEYTGKYENGILEVKVTFSMKF